MKDARDWRERDLYNLPIGEFDWLEVKGRRGLDLSLATVQEKDVLANLAKAVSALANTGGGQLVLGLQNPLHGWKVDDGGVDLLMRKPSTKEWLDNVIPNLVDFPLTRFNVYVIRGRGKTTQIQPGRGVFVIDIPDSDQAPHQSTRDHLYYARVSGKSQPIPHRLVVDMINRRRDPEIQVDARVLIRKKHKRPAFQITGAPPSMYGFARAAEEREPEIEFEVLLYVRLTNTGRVYAQYVNCFLHIPLRLFEGDPDDVYLGRRNPTRSIDGVRYVEETADNMHRDVIKYGVGVTANQYGPSRYEPILPGLSERSAIYLSPTLTKKDFDSDEAILWEVFADNAPMRNGRIPLNKLPVRIVDFTQSDGAGVDITESAGGEDNDLDED